MNECNFWLESARKEMGRAGRWLRGILGMKKGRKQGNGGGDDDFEIASFSSCDNHRKEKKRWSFSGRSCKVPASRSGGSCLEEFVWPRSSLSSESEKERSRRGWVKAAAGVTARMPDERGKQRWAALRIQSVFRGYLARKALKALQGIVKLQALIRGYMARKQAAVAADAVRVVQARAACRSFDKENVFDSGNWPRRSIERIEESRSSFDSDRSYTYPKIVGVDAVKQPHVRSSNLSRKVLRGFDPSSYLFATARGLPVCRSFVISHEPAISSRSVCGECPVLEKPVFPSHPNYMASTQSFDAKLRLTETPKKKPRRRIALREITAAARNSSCTSMDMQSSFSHYERYTF